MQNINVNQGQSLLDVVIEHTGGLAALMNASQVNGKGITEELISGSELSLDADEDMINRKNLDYYFKKKVHPASDTQASIGGIGSMVVEQTFDIN